MLVSIEEKDGMYVVTYCDRVISRKRTLYKGTQALAKYVKGHQ